MPDEIARNYTGNKRNVPEDGAVKSAGIQDDDVFMPGPEGEWTKSNNVEQD